MKRGPSLSGGQFFNSSPDGLLDRHERRRDRAPAACCAQGRTSPAEGIAALIAGCNRPARSCPPQEAKLRLKDESERSGPERAPTHRPDASRGGRFSGFPKAGLRRFQRRQTVASGGRWTRTGHLQPEVRFRRGWRPFYTKPAARDEARSYFDDSAAKTGRMINRRAEWVCGRSSINDRICHRRMADDSEGESRARDPSAGPLRAPARHAQDAYGVVALLPEAAQRLITAARLIEGQAADEARSPMFRRPARALMGARARLVGAALVPLACQARAFPIQPARAVAGEGEAASLAERLRRPLPGRDRRAISDSD